MKDAPLSPSSRLRVMRVIKTGYDSHNRPALDLQDGYGGIYLACPVLQIGGGSPGTFAHLPTMPPTDEDGPRPIAFQGADVLVAFPDDGRSKPIVLGALQSPAPHPSRARTRPKQAPDGDLPAAMTERDAVLSHKGAAVSIDDDGHIGLDASRTQGHVKVHVGVDGALRIAHTDTDHNPAYPVDERVPLGRALRAPLTEAHGAVSALLAEVAILRAALTALVGGALLPPPPQTPAPLPTTELLAAALLISSKSAL